MLERVRAVRGGERPESGFTLIELMVVVLVISILLGIAIPTFLGARNRAQDRAAQADLRNALTAGKTLFVDTQDYGVIAAASLAAVEPSLTYQSSASTGPRSVSVASGGSSAAGTFLNLAELAKDGNCWLVYEQSGSGSTSAGTTYAKLVNPSGGCLAPTTATTGSANWPA